MDLPTIAIAIGLIVSLLFTEAFGLSAGGMIVPGYFALSLNQPLAVVLTLLAAGCTFGLVRNAHGWRFAQMHTSAPASGQDTGNSYW